MQTHLVPKIMHQNFAINLQRPLNYSKNSFIVLVPEVLFPKLVGPCCKFVTSVKGGRCHMWLRGSVQAFHTTALGSNTEHSIRRKMHSQQKSVKWTQRTFVDELWKVACLKGMKCSQPNCMNASRILKIYSSSTNPTSV